MKTRKTNVSTINVASTAKEMNMKKVAFNATLSNSKQVGTKTYATIDASMLIVPSEYQRNDTTSEKAIKKLFKAFDVNYMDAIRVSPRYDTCEFAVIDGYHRLEVLKRKGMTSAIPCEIVTFKNAKDQIKEEAKVFLAQRTDPLSLVQRHKGEVSINDPIACAIERSFKKNGISFSKSNLCKVGETPVVTCVLAPKKIVKEQGEECLNWVFETIKELGWDKGSSGYTAYVIENLGKIYKEYGPMSKGLLTPYFETKKINEKPILAKQFHKGCQNYYGISKRECVYNGLVDVIRSNGKVLDDIIAASNKEVPIRPVLKIAN